MNKAAKIALLSIFSVFALIGITAVAGFFLLIQCVNDPITTGMEMTMKSVCSPQDHACGEHMFYKYLSCHFLHYADEEDCFNRYVASLSGKPYPNLAEPYMSKEKIVDWVQIAASDILDFDHKNLREKLGHAQVYFTPSGWKSFYAAMKEANIIEAVKNRKLAIELIPEGGVEVKNEGVFGGVYTWFVEIPMTIQFKQENGTPPGPIKGNLVLRVVRSSWVMNLDGVAIEQWVVMNSTTVTK